MRRHHRDAAHRDLQIDRGCRVAPILVVAHDILRADGQARHGLAHRVGPLNERHLLAVGDRAVIGERARQVVEPARARPAGDRAIAWRRRHRVRFEAGIHDRLGIRRGHEPAEAKETNEAKQHAKDGAAAVSG